MRAPQPGAGFLAIFVLSDESHCNVGLFTLSCALSRASQSAMSPGRSGCTIAWWPRWPAVFSAAYPVVVSAIESHAVQSNSWNVRVPPRWVVVSLLVPAFERVPSGTFYATGDTVPCHEITQRTCELHCNALCYRPSAAFFSVVFLSAFEPRGHGYSEACDWHS